MRRRRYLQAIGGAIATATAGCPTPLADAGSVLAAVHGSNRTDEGATVAVTVERNDREVATGTLELARHRADGESPTDALECTWEVDERGTFAVEARHVERDETRRRSTVERDAPGDTCQFARIVVEADGLRLALWPCDDREEPPPGYDCDGGRFDRG